MPFSTRHSAYFLSTGLACWLLTGCSSTGGPSEVGSKIVKVVRPYKIDIIQGNVVTREQMALVRPGMRRAEVRDLLGTSLLTSVFHANRWDYIFSIQLAGIEPQSRKVTVFFKDDVVEKIDAEDLPSESEFVSTLESLTKPDKLPALEASEERLKKFQPLVSVAPTTPAPSPERTKYPPLEPATP